MATLAFALRRPWLLYQGLAVDRDRPDLARLGSITEPEDFVWAMLPHAARSFAASILMLPAAEAKASAVAYLYARILDTYEDLILSPELQRQALTRYAARFEADPPEPAPEITEANVVDDRDRAHLLLVRRIGMVDAVYQTLPAADRESISRLIGAMADGMIWASSAFESQGGVLSSPEQRARYCHYVIGQPALFVLHLITPDRIDESGRDEALVVSEMIQMANITRDIERDLARGVAYHPALTQWLKAPETAERVDAVRLVRRELLVEALVKIPAFSRLLEASSLPPISRARGSAILMLRFTERYYQGAVARVGGLGWKGATASWRLYLDALAAALSRTRTGEIVGKVEDHFLAAAEELTSGL